MLTPDTFWMCGVLKQRQKGPDETKRPMRHETTRQKQRPKAKKINTKTKRRIRKSENQRAENKQGRKMGEKKGSDLYCFMGISYNEGSTGEVDAENAPRL
jgi:hypothetical protein